LEKQTAKGGDFMYKIPEIYLYMSSWNSYINLRQAGKDEPEPGYQYGPALREYYLVHVVTEGKGTYSARGTEYTVKAGDAFIIHPNEITVYTADKEDPWRYHFFSFSGEMAETLVPMMGFSSKRMVIPCPQEEVLPLIEDCIDNIQETNGENYLHSLMLLFRIVTCFAKHNPQAATEETQINHYVQKAIAYIEAHYTDNLTVNTLAEALAIDRSYLYRIFKSGTGMSPKEYLDAYRINIARSLLKDRDNTYTLSASKEALKSLKEFIEKSI